MNEEVWGDWRDTHDLLQEATADLDAQIAALQEERNKIAAPFQERLSRLEAEIKTEVIAVGVTTTLRGTEAKYRSGYSKVTYDWKQVDGVLGVLKDVLPQTANTLEKARKESEVSPSVSIKAV